VGRREEGWGREREFTDPVTEKSGWRSGSGKV
jgi:hypothetical protein